ncbi:MAG: TIGR02147 family protein [Pseudobacteriovorax sp.]|nr:TIGR02147 family protein [Pseudobacteriovorax sp.]
MNVSSPNIDTIIDTVGSSGELLRELYLMKKRERKTSLGAICRSIGIPSTGYLSDVMKGKKILNQKYWEATKSYFSFDEKQSILFHLLLDRDQARKQKSLDDENRLSQDIEILRQRISHSDIHRLSSRFANRAFALDVFAALGLKKNQGATLRCLKDFFGRAKALDVEKSVALLLQEGLVTIDDQGTIREANLSFHINDSEDFSHVNYLKDVISDTHQQIDHWYDNKELANFFSATIPVAKEQYQQVLSEIKIFMEERSIKLVSKDADSLVRLSFQAFPVATAYRE